MDPRAREQLEGLEADVEKQERLLASATSRDEALDHAALAAELTMKALKITRNKNERAELTAKCEAFLDQAETIKTAAQWPPLSTARSVVKIQGPPLAVASEDDFGKSPITETLHRDFINKLDLAKDTSSSYDRTTEFANSTSHGPISEETSPVFTPPTLLNCEASLPQPSKLPLQTKLGLDTLAARSPLLLSAYDGRPVAVTNYSRVPSHDEDTTTSDMSSLPSHASGRLAQVKPLKEPVSSRLLSKKEQIILLKASKINGFVCPPWKDAPVYSEFILHNEAEPFLDPVQLKLSSHQMDHFQSWSRAKDALPPPSWFSGDRQGLHPVMRASRPVDLVQDAATDCSVVASLCAGSARTERGHDSVFDQMIWPYDNASKQPAISPNGKYIVRLNFNGCWRKVIIDDRLPLSKTNRTLHVVDRKNSGLLWPALLEKAYLKIRGGYDFPGSNSCSDLWVLTGWIPEQIYLQEGDLVPNQLWSRLYKAFLYGDVFVTLGTGKMSHRAERELGLEGQHSYVILDMKENDHEKAFLVKNPWLEGKGWRGRRPSLNFFMKESSSSGNLSGSNEIAQPNSKHNIYPSTFWIGLDSVVQHFESLYLNWNTGLFSHRQDIHFSWDLSEGSTSSGCIADHPQFSFTSQGGGGAVWLVLSRHFRDAPPDVHNESDTFNDDTVRFDQSKASDDNSLKGYMNIYIYDQRGERVFIKDNYIERGQYVNTPQSLLRWESRPKSTYTVVIDQEELLASSYTFTLSAFTNSAMTLEHARQRYPFEKRISGSWTNESAGGNTHSSRYFDNPQFRLTISAHTPLAILLQTRGGQQPVHVKLVHGHGKRIHSIQSRDILVDSGEHRDGCALAESPDVLPGTYTVICSMFEAARIEDFSLTVYAVFECEIRSIPRDGAGMVPTKLANACFNSLVSKVSAPLVPRKIAAITVIVNFLRARTPDTATAPGKTVKNRNPLRILIETGRGPQKVLLASSNGGEFNVTSTVRTQRVDLRPDMLYDGDIWLVLERLSSPGSAVEEWYDVEILADTPQAFSAGVWRVWDD